MTRHSRCSRRPACRWCGIGSAAGKKTLPQRWSPCSGRWCSRACPPPSRTNQSTAWCGSAYPRLSKRTRPGATTRPCSMASAPHSAASQPVLDGLSADFGGLLVAEQARGDFELAVGAHWDATFGPVVMVGHGGVLVEAYQDMQFLLAPFTRAQALAAIARLRVARGFAATRGLPAVDLHALAAMLVTLGQWFVQQQGAFSSIDANPVLVSRTAAPVLVDAVVIPCAGARAERIRSH